MKIAFVTTQSLIQSTLVGRILPIAKELAAMKNDVTLLVHTEDDGASVMQDEGSVVIKNIGKNPFIRTPHGKKRKRGVALAILLLGNAIRASRALTKMRPDVIVIVKPLPENVFAVWLARMVVKSKIVLDVDDFELFANVVSGLPERAVLHWAERNASKMADHIIAATPFLVDHMRAIAQKDVAITLIPTGLTAVAPLEAAAKAGANNNTITYIGSISSSSGHLVFMLPEILECVRKEAPDANMIIAGSGDDEKKVKQVFAEKNLGNCVQWFGRFSDTDIPNIVSKTSVIVDPIDDSIVNRAKSSFRTMLACVSGLPVVTSNIGIRPIIIPAALHVKCFANAGDVQHYAQKIISLLKHPLTSEEVALLTEKAHQYSHQKTAELYYSCFL